MFNIGHCPQNLIGILEPWCSTLYCDANVEEYIKQFQSGTPFDLKKRVKSVTKMCNDVKVDIGVNFDARLLNNEGLKFLSTLPKVLADSGELGMMEYDIFRIIINNLDSHEEELVKNDSKYYTDQLISLPTTDPYYMNALFETYEKVKDT